MHGACVQVGDSKPGFYAIASPPDPNNAGLVELLIKSVPGTTAEILAGSSAGADQAVLLAYGTSNAAGAAKQSAKRGMWCRRCCAELSCSIAVARLLLDCAGI